NLCFSLSFEIHKRLLDKCVLIQQYFVSLRRRNQCKQEQQASKKNPHYLNNLKRPTETEIEAIVVVIVSRILIICFQHHTLMQPIVYTEVRHFICIYRVETRTVIPVAKTNEGTKFFGKFI